MREDNEKGAIVVEATLSLTTFVFTIFTILSLVNIYYIQSRISIALNSAAKEISQYSYLYYLFGLDGVEADFNEGTEEYKETAESTIDGVVTLVDSFSDAKDSVSTLDFEGLTDAIDSGTDTVDSLVTMYADQIADDPKAFILGMGKMALNELSQEGKKVLAQVMAKAFMKKNLVAHKGDSADAFLKRYRVDEGLAGLNFDYTTLMAYGKSNQIQLCVTYKVRVIKLLNIDFTFKFRQVAKTCAWGKGVSSSSSAGAEASDSEESAALPFNAFGKDGGVALLGTDVPKRTYRPASETDADGEKLSAKMTSCPAAKYYASYRKRKIPA